MSLMMSQPKVETGGVVVATAAFDPPIISAGQSCIYRVTFNALEQSVGFPSVIKTEPQLNLAPGAHGQILALAGPTLQPRSTFNSRVTATNAGDYTAPAFTVQVYGRPVEVPLAKLEVRPEPVADGGSQHLELGITQTNLFAGQPTIVQIILPTLPGGVVQGLAQLQLTGEGFLVDQSTTRQRIEMRSRSSPSPDSYIYEMTVTPIQTGKVSLFAQGFVGSQNMGIVVTGPGGIVPQAQYTLIESRPAELRVKPLPAGELPGFAGAIGDFALEPPRLETNEVFAGDPVKLVVTIRTNSSIGNLPRITLPSPPNVRSWQIFPAVAETAVPMVIQAQGFARFRYTLIPLDASATSTPAIPLSYFDPENATYVDLTIPPVPIKVLAKEDLARLPSELESPAREEDLLKLSGLALKPGRSAPLIPLQASLWFSVMQAIPFAAFLGLWSWARRRRFLALHPEILLRRRARVALKRERRLMRRAARAQNEAEFATAAVSAMRAACAPHYPADPRALVGGDVLDILTRGEDVESKNSAVVRRFFDATDGARFAGLAPTNTDLLRLQPEIEQVLERLETAL
jgi:hypothetical protein